MASSLHSISTFELISTLISLLVVSLGTRQKAFAWPLGIFSLILSLVVHYESHLYSKSLFNAIRIITSFYGWYQWRHGGKNKKGIQVSHLGFKVSVLLGCLGVVGTLVLGTLFHRYTEAHFPYRDAFYTAFALIGHVLLARKKLEAWALFFLLDLTYIPIYFAKERYFFTLKYLIYLGIAFYGYIKWKKSLEEERQQ